MPSPRVVLSPAAQSEIDLLLAAAIRVAKQHLAESSEFTPFALVADHDGRLLVADVDISNLGKHPESSEIADAIVAQLRAVAAIVRGTALIVNTRLSERKTDAIEVRLEHSEGTAVLVFLPYKSSKLGGEIDFGELMLFPATPEIWN